MTNLLKVSQLQDWLPLVTFGLLQYPRRRVRCPHVKHKEGFKKKKQRWSEWLQINQASGCSTQLLNSCVSITVFPRKWLRRRSPVLLNDCLNASSLFNRNIFLYVCHRTHPTVDYALEVELRFPSLLSRLTVAFLLTWPPPRCRTPTRCRCFS